MDDSSTSSTSLDASQSEGEYVLPQEDVVDGPPRFDFSSWNPQAPSGLSFLSLLPIGQGYERDPSPQNDLTLKIRPSTSHRKMRMKEFTSGRTMGRVMRDVKRLHHAASSGNTSLVEDLLESGVDPCSGDEKKRTALHIAATKGDERTVALLLDHGADPNQRDTIGNTALHLAACTNNIPVVTVLLRGGTDVNALDKSGRTPLHLARSRLNLINEETSYTSARCKSEAMHVIEMMKEYLLRTGHHQGATELDDICDRLQATSTREEFDSVNELLSTFTNMQIEQKHQPG